MHRQGVVTALLCDTGTVKWCSIPVASIGHPAWKFALRPEELQVQFATCLQTVRADGLNLIALPNDELRLWRVVWHRVDGIPGLRACVNCREVPVEVCHLSPRQMDVLQSIADYEMVTVRCDKLGITPRTYHSHVTRVREVLQRNDLDRIARWLFGPM